MASEEAVAVVGQAATTTMPLILIGGRNVTTATLLNQIQKLETMFKDFSHLDEKQRLQLSRELGLAPRQIKFWFQYRRTQMKAQTERANNCPTCGGPPVGEDPYFDEQKLRMENAQLKEELDRVSSIAVKYIERPISQLPPVQPIQISSLDLSMATFGGHGMRDPSLDLDLLPGCSSAAPNLPFHAISLTGMDKSPKVDVAGNAMDEFIRLLQNNEP